MRLPADFIPGALLLAIIGVVLWVAAGVFTETAEGFCAQLEPCHTEETQR